MLNTKQFIFTFVVNEENKILLLLGLDDKVKPYYLVITDEETGIEFSRTPFFIDITITKNFDF